MDPFDAPNAKMFGKATFGEVSIGTFVASHNDSPTETLDILCEAALVKPYIEHDIVNGPEEMAADPESLMMSRGSVAEYTNVAEPEARPSWWRHLTSSVAV